MGTRHAARRHPQTRPYTCRSRCPPPVRPHRRPSWRRVAVTGRRLPLIAPGLLLFVPRRSRSALLASSALWASFGPSLSIMIKVIMFLPTSERLVVKREAPLVSVFHNTGRRYLTLTPDANRLASEPYVAEGGPERALRHLYGVSLELGPAAAAGSSAAGELRASLLKLHKKWQKKHNQVVNFVRPPLGSAHYYVTVELVSARGFRADNLYIEYHIKLPASTRCQDALHGRTHVSEPSEVDGAVVCHFGHTMELCLEIDSGTEPSPATIYLETISRDAWRRHRTCGYARLALPPAAGARLHDLACIRPDERGAEERRFFLGGCHLIEDLELLSGPELQNGDYTYSEAGSIQVRIAVVAQAALPARGAGAGTGAGRGREASSASALLRGAEAALRKYKRARARLARATTDRPAGGGSQ